MPCWTVKIRRPWCRGVLRSFRQLRTQISPMPHEVGGSRPDRFGHRQMADVAHAPPTILIVEDNRDNLSIYTTILEYTGYTVLCAEDGVKGLGMARAASPSLI